MPPVNLLLLHSHNTGRYIQSMGHSVPTPHLQRLAEGRTLFHQAFAAAPASAELNDPDQPSPKSPKFTVT